MEWMGLALVVFGYGCMYAGMTGFLNLFSGGKIAKQSVLAALGITGSGGLSTTVTAAYGLNLNPFVNASALNISQVPVATQLGISQQMAPAAYLLGTGNSATAPVTGTQALGGGGGSTPASPTTPASPATPGTPTSGGQVAA